jgi:alkanesulfonate monooxygenase SsuD/methylene tetrahydromethanopterin reductase-like flavin-dependent oxidoreductase (luciferase family)
MLSRVTLAAKDEREARRFLEHAHEYYCRFDNVFTGPGIVENGAIAALPGTRTLAQLHENLLIGTPQQLIDRIAPYAELGLDDLIVNVNVGLPQAERLEAMQRLAEEVMPVFAQRRLQAAE